MACDQPGSALITRCSSVQRSAAVWVTGAGPSRWWRLALRPHVTSSPWARCCDGQHNKSHPVVAPVEARVRLASMPSAAASVARPDRRGRGRGARGRRVLGRAQPRWKVYTAPRQYWQTVPCRSWARGAKLAVTVSSLTPFNQLAKEAYPSSNAVRNQRIAPVRVFTSQGEFWMASNSRGHSHREIPDPATPDRPPRQLLAW